MNWPIWPTGTPKSHVRNHHGGSPQKDGLDQPQVVGGCHHATEEDHYLKSRPRIQAPMVGATSCRCETGPQPGEVFGGFGSCHLTDGPQEKTLLEVLGSPGLAVHDVLNTPRCKV